MERLRTCAKGALTNLNPVLREASHPGNEATREPVPGKGAIWLLQVAFEERSQLGEWHGEMLSMSLNG
jgi:hypothetical protein